MFVEQHLLVIQNQQSIDLMMGVAIGLSVAAMAMIGQTVGKGDIEKVKHICLQILVLVWAWIFIHSN